MTWVAARYATHDADAAAKEPAAVARAVGA
jgi:hypothetical protein